MTKVGFTFEEAWDLVYLLKSVVAESEYCKNIDLYALKDGACITHNKNDWERLHRIVDKLETTYGLNVHVG